MASFIVTITTVVIVAVYMINHNKLRVYRRYRRKRKFHEKRLKKTARLL